MPKWPAPDKQKKGGGEGAGAHEETGWYESEEDRAREEEEEGQVCFVSVSACGSGLFGMWRTGLRAL